MRRNDFLLYMKVFSFMIGGKDWKSPEGHKLERNLSIDFFYEVALYCKPQSDIETRFYILIRQYPMSKNFVHLVGGNKIIFKAEPKKFFFASFLFFEV